MTSLSDSNVLQARGGRGRRTEAILVTGAGGEMGHGLLEQLAAAHSEGGPTLLAMDLRELPEHQRAHCAELLRGDVRDRALLEPVAERFDIVEIYHLAAILSSGGERQPERAHEVNVDGTFALLRFAAEQGRRAGRRTRFIYPSTIAAYGLPDAATRRAAGPVHEEQWCTPITMYGCNKLYAEHLGRYYSRHYQLLAPERQEPPIDFRSIRFPGIISADTVPTGGTSDYAPEMIHAAAQGRPYACFVRPETRIPFTTMPEAIGALLSLARAPAAALTRCVYNIASFSPSAEEIAASVVSHIDDAKITFEPDQQRQAIVDSWPERVDDRAARRDFGWMPTHTFESALLDYLLPTIAARYR
jgi:nucleoside-diphosphate-sugar epimerase